MSSENQVGRGSHVGRFAPSPTGALHAGSLLAALGSWLMARARGGRWLVRVEDIDPPREVPGMADRQLADLRSFGFAPDGPVWRQSARGDAYAAALQQLVAQGDAFACRCSRGDLAASGGIHRACVARPSAEAPAWRLRLPDQRVGFVDAIRGPFAQDLAREVGDIVLRRADGAWAYHLAVVVDDAAQGVTEVVRGADLLDSTPRQLWLQRRLGLPAPAYAHLPLLRTADGAKLGKSLASAPVIRPIRCRRCGAPGGRSGRRRPRWTGSRRWTPRWRRPATASTQRESRHGTRSWMRSSRAGPPIRRAVHVSRPPLPCKRGRDGRSSAH
jgi:glutamyl-Q tRNA(Asp) synthetase